VSGQKGEALDQLRDGLKGQQCKAGGKRRIYRPADQAARVRRHLTEFVGASDKRPREIDHEPAQRQQEDQDAADVDDGALAAGELAGQYVDPHMAIVQEGRGRTEHEGSGEPTLKSLRATALPALMRAAARMSQIIDFPMKRLAASMAVESLSRNPIGDSVTGPQHGRKKKTADDKRPPGR
jgi:hypothetical protein